MSMGELFLRKLSDETLLDTFDLTEISNDEDVYTVRGWLMNEIERRHPEAWNRWLDTEALDNKVLREFILGGKKHE